MRIKTLTQFHELMKETEQDTPGYDVDEWEAKHNKTFYLRYIPSDVLREEIFTYVNLVGMKMGL